MFRNSKAFSGFAVDDLQKAREFYSDVLGLEISEEHSLLTLHLAGDRDALVNPKPNYTPATSVAASQAISPACRIRSWPSFPAPRTSRW